MRKRGAIPGGGCDGLHPCGRLCKLGSLCQRAGDRHCARVNYASFLSHWRGDESVADEVRRRLRSAVLRGGNRIGYERGKNTQNSALLNALPLLGFYNVSWYMQMRLENPFTTMISIP